MKVLSIDKNTTTIQRQIFYIDRFISHKKEHLSSMSKCLEELVFLKLQVDGYISDEWAVSGLEDCIQTIRIEIEELEKSLKEKQGETK